MSLCVSLVKGKKNKVVYDSNITTNLSLMAIKAGIYDSIWNPNLNKNVKKQELAKKLQTCLDKLAGNPEYFKEFNSSNGWGVYEDFVSFVEKYLEACLKYPKAKIEISK